MKRTRQLLYKPFRLALSGRANGEIIGGKPATYNKGFAR
jgi:hypothetical protein